MKNFVIKLFSNRFGIILAALNVCYFASIGFNPSADHSVVFSCMNLPAGIITGVSACIADPFLTTFSFSEKRMMGFAFFTFAVVFQWLFIAWIAQTLARKFRPNEL